MAFELCPIRIENNSFKYKIKTVITWFKNINYRKSMEELNKINTNTIQSQVYEKMKNLIMEGAWKVGEKIPSEAALSQKLGVGRVSIRSALQSLQAQGYIETKRGEGSYVKSLDLKEHIKHISPILKLTKRDAINIIEYRQLVEPNMMNLVIENSTDKDIKRLEEIYNRMIKNSKDLKLFAKSDVDFHYHLAKMTNNDFILSIDLIIQDIFLKSMEANIKIMDKSYAEHYHIKIIEAIKNKDKELARNIMYEHLETAKKNITISERFNERD